jgi:hypothetical protein
VTAARFMQAVTVFVEKFPAIVNCDVSLVYKELLCQFILLHGNIVPYIVALGNGNSKLTPFKLSENSGFIVFLKLNVFYHQSWRFSFRTA